MAENEEELKSLLIKMKEENERAGLKLNIQKMKIMASGPVISWLIDEETMETVTDFILGAPKSMQMVIAVILEPQKIKFVTVSFFSLSICHEVMGPDAMMLVF